MIRWAAFTLSIFLALATAAQAYTVSVSIPQHPKTWGVEITRAAWVDGMVCVSFVNHMDRPLKHVVFAITEKLDLGWPDTSYFHRWGTFAPNVPIEGVTRQGGWNPFSVHGRENCMRVPEPPDNTSPNASLDVTVDVQTADLAGS